MLCDGGLFYWVHRSLGFTCCGSSILSFTLRRLPRYSLRLILLLVFWPDFEALFPFVHVHTNATFNKTFIYSHNKIDAHVFLSTSEDLMPLEDLVRERANMLYVIILYYILYLLYVILSPASRDNDVHHVKTTS